MSILRKLVHVDGKPPCCMQHLFSLDGGETWITRHKLKKQGFIPAEAMWDGDQLQPVVDYPLIEQIL